MIVVFDASALISAALKANSIPERALFPAVTQPNHLILSRDVEDECREVIFRPKFDRFVSVEAVVHACRDPKDDKYLALALAGGADVIVSSDARHLLAMDPWRGVSILSPAAFLALP